MYPHFAYLLLLCTRLVELTTAEPANKRDPCESGYQQCSPSGAIGQTIPAIGGGMTGLTTLFQDLVDSVNQQPSRRSQLGEEASIVERDSISTVCCATNTKCLLLEGFSLAFCWDHFTTNYFLPDGSYGNIFSGNYTSASGGTANLINGNFSLPTGEIGNIYSSVPSARPNTAALLVPTPWTSRGIGTAISASQVGQLVTYITTISGSWIGPLTIHAQTITQGYGAGNVTMFSASTVSGTSVPPLTTTITAVTSLRPTGHNMGSSSCRVLPFEMMFTSLLIFFSSILS